MLSEGMLHRLNVAVTSQEKETKGATSLLLMTVSGATF